MSISLEHSPADISRAVLVNAGAGTDPSANTAWPIYAAGEPSSPDECITVYDTSARSDGRSMKDGEQWYHFGIQVRIRTKTHQGGFVKAWAVKKIMDESINQLNISVSSDLYYFHCFTNTNITYAGKETPTSKRSIFTINCYVTLRRIM